MAYRWRSFMTRTPKGILLLLCVCLTVRIITQVHQAPGVHLTSPMSALVRDVRIINSSTTVSTTSPRSDSISRKTGRTHTKMYCPWRGDDQGRSSDIKLLTLFTTFKPNASRYEVYRIVIRNWSMLLPNITPVLYASSSDDALVSYAQQHGWTAHLTPRANRYGTPFVKDMYLHAMQNYKSHFYGYANGDLIFDKGLPYTLLAVLDEVYDISSADTLVVGRRTNLEIEFEKLPQNAKTIIDLLKKIKGPRLQGPLAVDYFITRGGGWNWTDFMNLVIGRPGYDNYIVYKALMQNFTVVDATKTLKALHLTDKNCTMDHKHDNNPDNLFNLKIIVRSHVLKYKRDLINIDCQDIYASGFRSSGEYDILPRGAAQTNQVYCRLVNGSGWTMFQRRVDGSLNFRRHWLEYKYGFGSIFGEFWMGNEWLHLMTRQKRYRLRVEMWDWEGRRSFMEYAPFDVDNEVKNYRLSVGVYSGNAGDSLSFHDGMAFSTHDMDNDLSSSNCAAEYQSGWWFRDCLSSNLNGVYHPGYYSEDTPHDGIVWYTLKESVYYSLRKVELMIKPYM